MQDAPTPSQPGNHTRLQRAREELELRREDKRYAEDEYRRAQDEEQKAKKKLHEASMRAERLQNEHITLKDIKRILQGCLTALAELNAQLAALSSFFRQVHDFIKHIYEQRVSDFIEIAGAVTESPDTGGMDEMVDELKYDTTSIWIYYAAAFELATMYVDVSKKHIIPGIEMLGRLSARENSKRDIPAKNEMIRTYTMGALSEIRKIADKRQEELKEALVSYRGEAEEVYT